MQRDPIGAPDDNNLYTYTRNDPSNRIDSKGDDSTVRDGRIYIDPVHKSVPSVDIPNTVGAQGFSSGGPGPFHAYMVATPTVLSGHSAMYRMSEGIRMNPTPGRDVPASPLGTRNNVGALPTMDDTNFVKSFSVVSPDPSRFTDITVNYTVAGEHGAHEGFVMRYGEVGPDGNITMKSYGEGDHWRQTNALKDIWGPRVEEIWQDNAKEVVKEICTGSRIPKVKC